MAVNAIFSVDKLSFAYPGDRPALSDISFDLLPRERLTILGANGSGKSTLLKVLDGLLFPQSGRLLYQGGTLDDTALRESTFNARFRAAVALVFQNPDTQLFCSTVSEEIAFGPEQLGQSGEAIAACVQEMLALFRLRPLAHRAPYQLSGGEKKRVALAAALATKPDVLLLDEPTAALDPRSKWELIDLLLDLHARGKTLVTATHDMEIVEMLSDRVMVLGENKRVLGLGATAALLQDHALLEAANLIHVHKHRHQTEEHRHAHTHPSHEAEHHRDS